MSWFKKIFNKEKNMTTIEEPKEEETLCIEEPGVVSFYPEPPMTMELEPVEDTATSIPPLDLMKVSFKGSPNKSSRASGEPTHIVLHHTGPGSFNGIVNWLCNKEAKASAHYVVGTGAQIKQLVNTMKKAWHAGRAKWDGKTDVNDFSIGIEICNIGILEKGEDGNFYYEVGRNLKKYTGGVEPQQGTITYPSGTVQMGYFVPYPEKQIDKVVSLCKALVEKYPQITRDNIVTHYQVGQPEGRKNDPFGLDVEKIKDMIFGKRKIKLRI